MVRLLEQSSVRTGFWDVRRVHFSSVEPSNNHNQISMKTKTQHSTVIRGAGIVSSIAALLFSAPAQAQLHSVETFAGYTVGQTLPAHVPAPAVSGYTGDWAIAGWGGAQPAISSGSLSYGGLYQPGHGDMVGKGADAAGIQFENSGRASRLLGSLAATDASAGTVYLSWLFRTGNENAAGNADTYQTLALYNGDAGNDGLRTFDAGISAGDFATPDYAFRINNSGTMRSSFGVARDANVHLFVAKIDLSVAALSDSVTMWLDPTLGAGDPLGGIAFSGFDLRYDRLALSDYASNSSFWDDVRWGGTFDDVTVTAVPEPSAAALLLGGLGTVGAFLRRRKNQA